MRTRRPSKWLVVVVVVLLAYTAVQPRLNESLGWQLPSLASAIAPTDRANVSESPSALGGAASHKNDPRQLSAGLAAELVRSGLLRETAPEDYVSPAGLRYTRGSEEGHRLLHLQRHLTDDPQRPGKHGVFDGDMPQVIRWLDETYERAQNNASGTSRREEDGRTVYEANFAAPVGFVGGRDGKQHKNPAASKIRLVVEDNRVVTAFPF